MLRSSSFVSLDIMSRHKKICREKLPYDFKQTSVLFVAANSTIVATKTNLCRDKRKIVAIKERFP